MTKTMAALCLLASVLATLLGTGWCKGECGKNQEWSDCGRLCPKTCDHVTNMSSPICAEVCVEGCFCKQGYVLKDGRCVPEETCPCRPHAKYGCGTRCPLTCKNYLNPPMPCTKDCNYGCHCDKGYVRYGESGRCVLPKVCSYKG